MSRLPFPSVAGVAVTLAQPRPAPVAPRDPSPGAAREPAPLAHLREAIRRWLEEEL